jgi:hypothetical protein
MRRCSGGYYRVTLAHRLNLVWWYTIYPKLNRKS